MAVRANAAWAAGAEPDVADLPPPARLDRRLPLQTLRIGTRPEKLRVSWSRPCENAVMQQMPPQLPPLLQMRAAIGRRAARYSANTTAKAYEKIWSPAKRPIKAVTGTAWLKKVLTRFEGAAVDYRGFRRAASSARRAADSTSATSVSFHCGFRRRFCRYRISAECGD